MTDKEYGDAYKSIKAPASLRSRVLDACAQDANAKKRTPIYKHKAFRACSAMCACLVLAVIALFLLSGGTGVTVYLGGEALTENPIPLTSPLERSAARELPEFIVFEVKNAAGATISTDDGGLYTDTASLSLSSVDVSSVTISEGDGDSVMLTFVPENREGQTDYTLTLEANGKTSYVHITCTDGIYTVTKN